LDVAFIDHLYTQLISTTNYSATADLHNSQITTAPVKPFTTCCVFTSRSLVITTCNSGDSSASALKSSSNGGSLQTDSFLPTFSYRTDLVAPAAFLITSRVAHEDNTPFILACCLRGNGFTETFPSSSRLFLLITNFLLNNGRRSVVCFAAVA
jgi:hypothetical protein